MKKDLEEMLKNPRFVEILDRAAAIYSRVGYEGTTIRDIAAALDIKSASLYYYFDSKEDILFAIMWKFHSAFLDEITPMLNDTAPALEVLRKIVEAHIRFDLRCWNDVIVSLRERTSLSSDRRDAINRLRRQYRDALAKLVMRGSEQGTWAAREPIIIASAILDTINGLVQWYRPRGEADLSHIIDIYASGAVALVGAPSDISTETGRSSSTPSRQKTA